MVYWSCRVNHRHVSFGTSVYNGLNTTGCHICDHKTLCAFDIRLRCQWHHWQDNTVGLFALNWGVISLNVSRSLQTGPPYCVTLSECPYRLKAWTTQNAIPGILNQHLMDIQPSPDVDLLLQSTKSRDLAFRALCLIHAVSFSWSWGSFLL